MENFLSLLMVITNLKSIIFEKFRWINIIFSPNYNSTWRLFKNFTLATELSPTLHYKNLSKLISIKIPEKTISAPYSPTKNSLLKRLKDPTIELIAEPSPTIHPYTISKLKNISEVIWNIGEKIIIANFTATFQF